MSTCYDCCMNNLSQHQECRPSVDTCTYSEISCGGACPKAAKYFCTTSKTCAADVTRGTMYWDECASTCYTTVPKYDCVYDDVTEQSFCQQTDQGSYESSDCNGACAPARYSCNSGQCIKGTVGDFGSVAECLQSGCIGWACNQGSHQCTQAT